MKYAGPFLLNGSLFAGAIFWLRQASGLGALGFLVIVLAIGFLLNIVLAILYFHREDLRVGFLYLAVAMGIALLFHSLNSQHHGKMVNG